MKGSLIFLLLTLSVTLPAIALPLEIKGAASDEFFLATCEARVGGYQHWSGRLQVVESGRESSFKIDHPASDNWPAEKADRRSVAKLCRGGFALKPGEGQAKEVAWFAYNGENGLVLMLNSPMGKYERELLGQVREGGDWHAMNVYFLGGESGNAKEGWIASQETVFSFIAFGQSAISPEPFLEMLEELGVIILPTPNNK